MANKPLIIRDSYLDTLKQLLADIVDLRKEIETNAASRLEKYKDNYRAGVFTRSASNLAHYLALRQFDLRHLQDRLAQAGLSSLGRSEASVLSTLDAVLDILQRATNKSYLPGDKNPSESGFHRGQQLLDQHSMELFGPFHENSRVHVMVTLPTEAAWNYELVLALLEKGMTCARINCAHDEAVLWRGMVKNIHRAETETGKICRIMMDLAGHKIRTGSIAEGLPIHRIKVKKDICGKVAASEQLILTTDQDQPETIPNDATSPFSVSIPESLHKKLEPGDMLGFIDARKKQRYLQVDQTLSKTEWLVSCKQSSYLVSGCELTLFKAGQIEEKDIEDKFALGLFSGEPMTIQVYKNDLLLLTENDVAGAPAEYDDHGVMIKSAQIGCTLSSFSSRLKPGQSVWIDDGKIGAVVESISGQGALLRIIQARSNGVRIQSDKGINFPETALELSPLSEKDLIDLDFACAHADLIGFSFVETLADMELLMAELAKRRATDLPIIAKIETNLAVKNLPDIILGSIGRHSLGIMIARGDLAVELGSARLAEIQEELLWLCEAAHVPVIWATQVLESIAKKGVKSRPEFTDAAMAVRAECVMLNKGPYILDAIEALVNVMIRMQEHQRKKFSRLRALHW
ncbi:MAG: pyruvate kinase [Methylococcaceae bacterium]